MSLNSMDRIKMLLKARTQCIWVRTFEEKRFIDELSSLIRTDFSTFTLMVHSLTQGLAAIPVTQKPKDVVTFDEKKALIQKIFLEINNAQNNPDKNAPNFMFVLRDFDDAFVQAVTIRTIRDLKPAVVTNTYTPIFIVSPTADVPLKLSKMFQIVDYDVPSKQYVSAMVNAAVKTAIKNENDLIAKLKEENKPTDNVKKFTVPTDKQKENIVKSLIGLTANEIMGILMRSMAEYNALDERVVMEEKINAIKATGVLDYRVPKVSMKDIGGNDEFKNWFEDVRMCFSPDAKRLNIPMQKGYLAIGHPGTCKSLMAEAVAKELSVPLIKLDISNILSGVVGASETRIKQALTQVRQMAPAVLFIDEVEKCIGGIASSNASDSGVISRVVEALLDFMTSDTNVFVIMTSNDASNLPSELTRPGRLDTQWFFGFPTEDERKEIFKIHLDVYDQKLTGSTMDKAIEKTSDFTGAEIELSVKAAIRKAYKRFSSEGTETRILVTEDDILSSISEIVPIKNYAKEQVRKLEEYARNRARRTSTVSKNEVDIVSGFDVQQIEAVIPTKNVVRN